MGGRDLMRPSGNANVGIAGHPHARLALLGGSSVKPRGLAPSQHPGTPCLGRGETRSGSGAFVEQSSAGRRRSGCGWTVLSPRKEARGMQCNPAPHLAAPGGPQAGRVRGKAPVPQFPCTQGTLSLLKAGRGSLSTAIPPCRGCPGGGKGRGRRGQLALALPAPGGCREPSS